MQSMCNLDSVGAFGVWNESGRASAARGSEPAGAVVHWPNAGYFKLTAPLLTHHTDDIDITTVRTEDSMLPCYN